MRYFTKILGATFIAIASLTTTAFAQGPAAPVAPKQSDHDAVVGRLAVGYLGASQVAVGAQDGAVVQAPVVGVRYWIDEMLGLDLGLGFGMTSGSSKETLPNQPSETVDDPSFMSVIAHVGVPLSFSQGEHYSFQIVPEANVGFGSGEQKPLDPENDPKLEHSGFRLDIGARAGAELHFGFIGVPELSLQGSVGLQFVTASVKTEAKLNDQTAKYESSGSRIGTTVHDNPWNIFTTNVAALYYF
jgi:hypothetical protein